MAKSLSHFESRIWKCSFHSKVVLIFEHRKGVYQNSTKNSKTWFLKKAILRVKWRYWGDFSSMFRKKNETFSIDVIWTLLLGASSISHALSDFEVLDFFGHIVVICQCGLESFEVLESWVTLEGWVILPVKSHWTIHISTNFCLTAKSFGWL